MSRGINISPRGRPHCARQSLPEPAVILTPLRRSCCLRMIQQRGEEKNGGRSKRNAGEEFSLSFKDSNAAEDLKVAADPAVELNSVARRGDEIVDEMANTLSDALDTAPQDQGDLQNDYWLEYVLKIVCDVCEKPDVQRSMIELDAAYAKGTILGIKYEVAKKQLMRNFWVSLISEANTGRNINTKYIDLKVPFRIPANVVPPKSL